MTRYFILIKRKSSKKYLGAIPARVGITLAKLRVSARKQIKSMFSYRIISEGKLKEVLPKMIRKPKVNVMRKPMIRRRVSKRSKNRSKSKRSKK